jgi:hypothetical protein
MRKILLAASAVGLAAGLGIAGAQAQSNMGAGGTAGQNSAAAMSPGHMQQKTGKSASAFAPGHMQRKTGKSASTFAPGHAKRGKSLTTGSVKKSTKTMGGAR